MTSLPTLIPNGRIWIDTADGPFLGYGRVELLEKIKELGSIRKAALEMKMSYRQAWQLIDQINHRMYEPLVLMQRGGKGGGQAVLTELGEHALSEFKRYNEAFQQFLATHAVHLPKTGKDYSTQRS